MSMSEALMTYEEALGELRQLRMREAEIRRSVTQKENLWLTLALYQDVLLAAPQRPLTREARALLDQAVESNRAIPPATLPSSGAEYPTQQG